MSIVGPRPHALSAKASGTLYQKAVPHYSARHRVKPGITGWAQINGWRGPTDTLRQIQMRVAHVNADWPTGFAGDDTPTRVRGVSDHDPSLARFRLVTHPPSGRPEASITPDVVDFGDVEVGKPSPERTVLLANTGVLPLHVTALRLDGAQAGEFAIVSPTRCSAIRFGSTGSIRGPNLRTSSNQPRTSRPMACLPTRCSSA